MIFSFASRPLRRLALRPLSELSQENVMPFKKPFLEFSNVVFYRSPPVIDASEFQRPQFLMKLCSNFAEQPVMVKEVTLDGQHTVARMFAAINMAFPSVKSLELRTRKGEVVPPGMLIKDVLNRPLTLFVNDKKIPINGGVAVRDGEIYKTIWRWELLPIIPFVAVLGTAAYWYIGVVKKTEYDPMMEDLLRRRREEGFKGPQRQIASWTERIRLFLRGDVAPEEQQRFYEDLKKAVQSQQRMADPRPFPDLQEPVLSTSDLAREGPPSLPFSSSSDNAPSSSSST